MADDTIIQDSQYELMNNVFKHQDTTDKIIIRLKSANNVFIKLNPTHTWKAQIAQSNGYYIGTYPLMANGTRLELSTASVTELDPGDYTLEIWETYTDENGNKQKHIYPSPGSTIPFTVQPNLMDSDGNFIKKIGFQDVVNTAVENAGLNLKIGNVSQTDVGTMPTVTQEYQDGKNIVSFTFPKPRAATVTIDKVNTVAPDQPASVTNIGTDTDAKFVINLPQGIQGVQGFRGPAGKNFNINKTFDSISAMEASKGSGFADGDYAMIASNPQDPDNSKLYVWNGNQFVYISDLSGTQGIKGDTGPAPAMSVSSVTKLPAGSQPTVTYKKVEGGYTVAYALPQGADGATWQPYINKDDGHWHIKLTQGLPAVTEDDMKRLQDFITNQIENGKW